MPYLKLYRFIVFAVVLLTFSCRHQNGNSRTDSLISKDTASKKAQTIISKKDTVTNDTTATNPVNRDHFHSPAIAPNENVGEDFEILNKSDVSNWKDIKSDTTSVAFTYSHGYESTYGIAYSKGQKKVVLIFYSD